MQAIPTPTPELIGAATAAQGSLADTALQPGDLGWTKVLDNLSPINGFTALGAPWPNELWINSEGLKLVRFGLVRATNPAGSLAAFRWSGYPSSGNWDHLAIDNNTVSRYTIETSGSTTDLLWIPVLNSGAIGTVGHLFYL